jgi:D-alanine-D-alanine ligase
MNSKNNLTIGIIFGERSFEHEVSLVSARAIIKELQKKYKIVLIGINKDGKWLLGPPAKKLLMGQLIKEGRGVSIIPEKIIKK